MSPQTRHLLHLIEQAFARVELGDGVSLHQTIEIDRHETGNARDTDEKHDWRKLIHDPELAEVCGVGGLSFYDAEGLRFHLPEYLSWALTATDESDLQGLLESLQFTLTHLDEYQRQRFAILNNEQRQCVVAFLEYMRDEGRWKDYGSKDHLTEAIEGYWSLPLQTPANQN